MQQQSVRPKPNPHNPDKSVNAEQPPTYVPSHITDYDWKGNLPPSLQGTLSSVAEPSYNINSWPLDSSTDNRKVFAAAVLRTAAEEARREYVDLRTEALRAELVAVRI